MSNMSELDTILSEYKLSAAQKNAVLEVIAGEIESAKTNTLKSLEKKGLIFQGENGWFLEDDLHLKINPIVERNKEVFEAFDTVAEVQEVMLTSVGGEIGDKADKLAFVEPYAPWELEAMGVAGWRNTDGAWGGLTRKQIKEDIKSAFGVNRETRRKHTKLLTSEYRKIMCPRPRKGLKLTGKVGV